MNTLRNKPYASLWAAIPLILVLSLIAKYPTVDIRLHDSYYVINSLHVGLILSIFLGAMGFFYWLLRKKQLVSWMTLFHVIATITCTYLFAAHELMFKQNLASNIEWFRLVRMTLFWVILIAILSQLVFIVNVLICFNKNRSE